MSRRSFLKRAGGAAALAATLPDAPGVLAGAAPKVIVVGAGAFGGWTALHLLNLGAEVTLLDAWGPGNSRASSGGETRVIRATYGPDRIYVEMVARALTLWKQYQQLWNQTLYHAAGTLWMVGGDGKYEEAALPLLHDARLKFERLESKDAQRRWPQVDFAGVDWVIHEPDAGYLEARHACEMVARTFQRGGGAYWRMMAQPGHDKDGRLLDVALSDGTRLTADHFVFALGPWLKHLLPGDWLKVTRQEVFFFGTPPGDNRFYEAALPVWIDNGERLFYGIPGNSGRGFKLADDTRGPEFDPTSGDRTPSPERMRDAREYLASRFPGMKDAPLLEARVCQYENSPDGHFILDRHPEVENLWFLGGGSGHGFKHGPAMGEMAAEALLGRREPPKMFRLERFSASPSQGAKHEPCSGWPPRRALHQS